MTARLRELAERWKDDGDLLIRECADELLAILDAAVAVSEELSEVWVVQDETGQPVYCASWPEACHEHINDAINEHGIEEAKAWKVLHYANGTTSATKELQPDEDYVSRLWNAMGQAHPTKSSLRAALAFLSPSTSPARSGGVSDADVERGLEMMFGVTGKDADVYRPGMRAALTNFAKGVEVGGDVEDAARYRWLRRNHNADLLAEDVIDEAIQGERREVCCRLTIKLSGNRRLSARTQC